MIDFCDKDDKFVKGTTFEKIYNIYKTDKEVRAVSFEDINYDKLESFYH